MLRTLAITLESDEAELKMCIDAIMAQKDTSIDHVIISGLPELEAHNEMLKVFREHTDQYDLYVKVDADTIIDHSDAFVAVHAVMEKHSAAAAELPLFDYFTCTNIMGLNFYIPKRNEYVQSVDRLYCDRSIVKKGPFLSTSEFKNTHLQSIGRHCVAPNDRQAFHYGYHRGLKNRLNEENLTKKAAETHKDRARQIACVGFRYARTHVKQPHEYTAQEFNAMFKEALSELTA